MNLKLILIFLIFMSCNSEKKTIIGIYNSKMRLSLIKSLENMIIGV